MQTQDKCSLLLKKSPIFASIAPAFVSSAQTFTLIGLGFSFAVVC